MNMDKIAPAFVAAQAELGGVVKDSKNPHFRSNYASLEAVMTEARPVLKKHKLAVLQMPGSLTDAGLNVTTMLLHESGQSIEGTLTIPITKRDPQGVGSAITYACRYALMAMLGMPPVDDDGESAMLRGNNDDAAPPKTTPKRNDKAIATHRDVFRFALARADTPEDVRTLWLDDTQQRESLGIVKGSEAYEALSGMCRDRIEEIGLSMKEAEAAGVP